MRTVRCSGRLMGRGVCPEGGEGVSTWGVSPGGDVGLGRCTPAPPRWTEFVTHACENIAFCGRQKRNVSLFIDVNRSSIVNVPMVPNRLFLLGFVRTWRQRCVFSVVMCEQLHWWQYNPSLTTWLQRQKSVSLSSSANGPSTLVTLDVNKDVTLQFWRYVLFLQSHRRSALSCLELLTSWREHLHSSTSQQGSRSKKEKE